MNGELHGSRSCWPRSSRCGKWPSNQHLRRGKSRGIAVATTVSRRFLVDAKGSMHSLRIVTCCWAAVMSASIFACSDSTSTPSDAGLASEAGDASPDGGFDDATPADDASGDAADGEASSDLKAPVCLAITAGQVMAAVSPDATRVAFLSCADLAAPRVIVRHLESQAETSLGSAPAGSSIEWLLDGEHVLFGTASELWVRRADASSDAIRVAEGTADAHRTFKQRVNSTLFAPRLLVAETLAASVKVTLRGPDDGYAAPTTLFEGPRGAS